jgi:hypothetical protein
LNEMDENMRREMHVYFILLSKIKQSRHEDRRKSIVLIFKFKISISQNRKTHLKTAGSG